MKRLTFQCTLLSDVIINQKSASTGNQKTLDFIPGSNFYGIVANEFYKTFEEKDASPIRKEDLFLLLHSGKLRFGDAHPSIDGKRSLRVPAAMFHPKLGGIEECYIHHALTDLLSQNEEIKKEMAKKQLKQCRNGFYIFSGTQDTGTGIPVQVNKTFAIKSAYDHNKRRSKDEQMYGYQSMDKGLSLIFHLTYDEEEPITADLIDKVKNILIGRHRVGRSRTAQYGLVEIEEMQEDKNTDKPDTMDIQGEQEVTVYADSRLIFFDSWQLPTFTPTAKDFGFTDQDRIVWEKSQIRTFQYSPWNYARQAYDPDRCGIEKGSVIVIRTNQHTHQSISYTTCVGKYVAEGFGQILFNPAFLQADERGMARYKLQKENNKEKLFAQPDIDSLQQSENTLLQYLYRKGITEKRMRIIYQAVNTFIDTNKQKFTGKEQKKFASQWSQVRSIATQCADKEELEKQLYPYLTHGVAKDKWTESGRLEALRNFVDFTAKHPFIGKKYAPLCVLNLAAEMAKICSKKPTK